MPVKPRKAKFKVGQVIAECYNFRDGKGEYVKSYFALNEVLAGMYNKSNLHRGTAWDRWIRPLTKRERG